MQTIEVVLAVKADGVLLRFGEAAEIEVVAGLFAQLFELSPPKTANASQPSRPMQLSFTNI